MDVLSAPNDIDLTARADPILAPPKKEISVASRVFQASIPFACMYRPLALPVTVLLGSLQVGSLVQTIRQAPDSTKRQAGLQQLGLVVTRTTLGVFKPQLGALMGAAVQLHRSTQQYLDGKDSKARLINTTLSEFLHVASLYYPNAALLAAALMLQSLKEGNEAYDHAKKGEYIEAIAKFVLTLIRGKGALDQATIAYNRLDIGTTRKNDDQRSQKETTAAVTEKAPPKPDQNRLPQETLQSQEGLPETEVAQAPISGEGSPISGAQEPQSISAAQLVALLRGAGGGSVTSLGEALDRGNFSRTIEGIECRWRGLSSISIEGVEFRDCVFECFDFIETNINNTRFVDCVFESSAFLESDITDTAFHRCCFSGVYFEGCNLESVFFSEVTGNDLICYESTWCYVLWKDSQLIGSYFSDSCFERVAFAGSTLVGGEWENLQVGGMALKDCTVDSLTLWGGSHEGYVIEDSTLNRLEFNNLNINRLRIEQCSLSQVSALGCDVHRASISHSSINHSFLPPQLCREGCTEGERGLVVGVGWHAAEPPPFAAGQVSQFRDKGAIPLLWENFPEEIDTDELEQEVFELLKIYRVQPTDGGSILRSILESAQAGSQVAKLRELGAAIASQVDLVVLPGGMDVEPDLYGHPLRVWTEPEHDWRRSLLEGAVLLGAEHQQCPVLGVCRGEQMINVFYGGTVNQDVSGEWGVVQNLQISGVGAAADLLRTAFDGDSLQAYSCHHQAVEEIGKGLEVLIEHDGVTKAVGSLDGRVLGLQFHPEASAVLPKEVLEWRGEGEYDEDHFAKNDQIFVRVLEQASKRVLPVESNLPD
ncbi:MAG: gamma-glutamyl-gamma-aminobutyrate hydrolase family protein [Candidatus Obscuribacterales bacterium]